MNAVSQSPLLVITGPTASGKTAVALQLARRFDGELIGADSVQVYRGFDIGSAKPDASELAGVRHHLLDICNPDEDIDAARFAQLADAAIADVLSRGKRPIVVGGSGLWLRALLRGLVKVPDRDPALRATLEAEAETTGLPAMHARLAAVDPRAAGAIHPNDKLRIVRALEVYAQTGQPLGELRHAHALGGERYHALRVVLELTPEESTARITERTHTMIARGLADETRAIVTAYGREIRALGAVGYREMLSHVCDGVDLPTTAEAITRATRVYARRQRTWLQSEPGSRWNCRPEGLLDPAGEARIVSFLTEGTRAE
jgi:tRNA dimethylallyltransferase